MSTAMNTLLSLSPILYPTNAQTNMYSQVPKWIQSESPRLSLSLSLHPTRMPQSNHRRTKNMVCDPNTESLASNENELPSENSTDSNFAFSTKGIPHHMVRFNRPFGGGGHRVGWKGNKLCLAWRDLRVEVPKKIGRGLRTILQGVTEEVSAIAAPSDHSGKTTLLDVLAWVGLNKGVIDDHRLNLTSAAIDIQREEIVEEFGKIKNDEIEGRIYKKPRFLCLHGHRMSAKVLQKQLNKRWPKTLLGKLDLVFLDGPYPAQGKSDMEGFYDPPFYEWFQYDQDCQEAVNFDECVAYIEDYMMKHGPFDGLMGFSQGAVLSAHLPGMQSAGVALTKVPKIKYVVIMSGAKMGGSVSKFGCPKLASKAFSSPAKIPSLHIIGEADYLKEPSIELLDSFVDPLQIHHPWGHTVAKFDEKGQKTLLNFIEKIEKM